MSLCFCFFYFSIYYNETRNERYFILHNRTLSYYVRRGDMEPKGEFQLFPECKVSEIVVEGKETKKNNHHRGNSTASVSGLRTPERSSSKKRNQLLEEQQQQQQQDCSIPYHESSGRRDGGRRGGILYTFRVTWPAAYDGGVGDPDEGDNSLLPGTPTGTPEHIYSGDEKEEGETTEESSVIGEYKQHLGRQKPSIIRSNHNMMTDHHLKKESPPNTVLVIDSNNNNNLEQVTTTKGDILEPKSPTPLSPISLKRSTSSFTRSPFTLRKNMKTKPTVVRSLPQELQQPPPPPPAADVNTTHLTSTNNINNNMGEEIIEALKAVKKARNKKKQRKIVASGGVVAATGALITTTVLTGGLSLATLLTVIGISTAATTSGAVASRTFLRSKQQQSSPTSTLVLASLTLEDAQQWRNAIIDAINNSDSDDDDDSISERGDNNDDLQLGGGIHFTNSNGTWANLFALGGHNPASVLIPNVASVASDDESASLSLHLRSAYARCGTKWKPVISGWVSFLGMGSTGLRIFEEEEKLNNNYSSTESNAKLQGENFCQMISVKGT